MFAMIEILFIPLLILLFAGVGLAGAVLWIWMLIDCAVNEPPEGNEKLVWILVILFAHPIIGALIYLLVRRPQRKRLLGR